MAVAHVQLPDKLNSEGSLVLIQGAGDICFAPELTLPCCTSAPLCAQQNHELGFPDLWERLCPSLELPRGARSWEMLLVRIRGALCWSHRLPPCSDPSVQKCQHTQPASARAARGRHETGKPELRMMLFRPNSQKHWEWAPVLCM